MVRIQNGVVVSIDDLFPRAGLYFFCVAGGSEFFELLGIAAEIRRPVAADSVQNDKQVVVLGVF